MSAVGAVTVINHATEVTTQSAPDTFAPPLLVLQYVGCGLAALAGVIAIFFFFKWLDKKLDLF